MHNTHTYVAAVVMETPPNVMQQRKFEALFFQNTS